MQYKIKEITTNDKINYLLDKLFLKVQFILADNLVGMYIGGSVANHSFNSETSDIDCYIITKKQLTAEIIHQIESMHKQFYSSELSYATRIEASYIPLNDLLDFDPKRTRPYFNEGHFYLAHYGINFLIELYVLRDKAITVVGENIKNLIKEISIEKLKSAIKDNLHEYWEVTLKDLNKYSSSDYQVFTILTMCRTLYSLETGKITSKAEAANWVVNQDNAKWIILIKQAINWKPGDIVNKLEETQQFVRYVLEKNNTSPHFIFISGASGAGKTTLVNNLKNNTDLSGVCLHFDSIGVPSEEEMIQKYGSTSDWQKAMTDKWVEKLVTEYNDKKLVILEGQVNLDFIESAFKNVGVTQYSILLIHCSALTRNKRLHHERNQPELINKKMDNWSNYLKHQAIEKNVPILDSTLMTINEMIYWFKEFINTILKKK